MTLRDRFYALRAQRTGNLTASTPSRVGWWRVVGPHGLSAPHRAAGGVVATRPPGRFCLPTLRDRFYALRWEQQQAIKRGLRVLATFGLCVVGFVVFVWVMVRAYQ